TKPRTKNNQSPGRASGLPTAQPANRPVFRPFAGEPDFALMVAIINGSKEADGLEWATTVEDVARNYQHLVKSDPDRDVTFVEVNGQAVGYTRVWWMEEADGKRLYCHFAHLRPEWRRDGLRRSMLLRSEARLREIAADHPDDGMGFFQAGASDGETHWHALLRDESYEPVRYGLSMVRASLEDVTDEYVARYPLPEGVEVRPVRPEQVRQIWEASQEAFRDHWGFSEDDWSWEQHLAWQESPTYNPALWQVAWEGDEVAGMVQNFIDAAENKEYERRRGYTEGICVRRPWRRRGLARALIARSFQVVKEQGMAEASLGVDAENLSGALHLYKSMGFREVKRFTTYRKPL
ncbi:MAG TPA: GNAT family N-acetyltransferase, partial [Anaerolineae bacterium]|nr:GNAT family N-acetyltransferase [Anaerolineae bacterium]